MEKHTEDIIRIAVIVGLICFTMYAWHALVTHTPTELPCEDYRDSPTRFLPARCINYFNQPQ
jgi:hypothetical protein